MHIVRGIRRVHTLDRIFMFIATRITRPACGVHLQGGMMAHFKCTRVRTLHSNRARV